MCHRLQGRFMRLLVFAFAAASSSLTPAQETATASPDVALTTASEVMSLPATTSELNLDDVGTTDVEAEVAPLFPKDTQWLFQSNRNGYSLNELWQLGAQANPNWGTFNANHQAAHAELLAATAYPNPEVEIEIGRERAREADENGNRPSAGTYGLGFSQPIELPGKRLARRVEAEAGFAVVGGELTEFNSTLRAEIAEAYWTVQFYSAQERLQKVLLDVANRLSEIANARVELGVAGTIERVNARIETLRAERDLKVATRRKKAALAALDALVGGRLGNSFVLAEPLPSSFKKVGLSTTVQTALSRHPRLQRLAAELEQRYASLDRQRTEWWPDLHLGARTSREMDSESAAITASIEVPLWNRNEGGIAKAEAEAQRKYNDIAIAFTELRRDVESAYQNYEIAREQVASYEDGLREATEEAADIAYAQYQLGAAGYLDVLTARRMLQESEQGYLQALYDAAVARARLERARGDVITCPPPVTKPVARKAR